jgi:predicted metal-dependent RNase
MAGYTTVLEPSIQGRLFSWQKNSTNFPFYALLFVNINRKDNLSEFVMSNETQIILTSIQIFNGENKFMAYFRWILDREYPSNLHSQTYQNKKYSAAPSSKNPLPSL